MPNPAALKRHLLAAATALSLLAAPPASAEPAKDQYFPSRPSASAPTRPPASRPGPG